MVVNAAVQMIREAEELKQNILKFKSDTSMLQECSLWPSQQQLQKIYQKVLVLDLDYALDKKVEQDLWNVGFKQQIEALQAISKDRKNPLRGEAQAMLAWVLQAAAGFYLCLLHQICTAFKLDLPFRRRASLLGWVQGWSPGAAARGARLPPPAAARYICQHCLVHLGDLARYRQQPRVAYTFYRHALVVSPHSGQPYNQLALLARRRGRRLGALYWHVRAVLVRAPFPPAPANLLRTLQQHSSVTARPAPVLAGVRRAACPAPAAPARLDAHSYVTELMRALYLIHTLESLDFAATLVETLNGALASLVATDSFESMTLIKMVCVIIWLVHSCTEDQAVGASALSAAEASGAALAHSLAAGLLLALSTNTAGHPAAQPALKVCLQWATLYPQLLATAAFGEQPQLWHALAHTLNALPADDSDKYDTVPLPEDEELHGFQPLERSFKELKFSNHAAWDTYGRRVPDVARETGEAASPPSVVSPASLNNDPELEAAVRGHRLIELGKTLADLRPDQFTYSAEDRFAALGAGGAELSLALARLAAAAAPAAPDDERDSDDDAPLPAPIVISEADFREKVRDKRVGILKPQGSLERAREERALAGADDQDSEECADEPSGDDRRDTRRPRVNIAMAAILRKQEESCKQVKFRTPPPVSEECEADTTTSAETPATQSNPVAPRPQALHRPNKTLANIPVGRKTGGILALKDKSGYPHLVNVAVDPSPRPVEKPAYKDPKVIQPPSHIPKRETPAPKWHQPYEPRPALRTYGLQNVGITYNYDAPATATSQNIRLPVVNPKEIDVRSAALQKQISRSDYQHRSATYTGDKKSFLDDLPPRFANQRWYQEQDNKFKNDYQSSNPDNVFNAPPPSWLNPLTPPLRSQPQSSITHSTQLSMPPPSHSSQPPMPPASQMSMSQLSMPSAPLLSMPSPAQMSMPPPQLTMSPLSPMSVPPPSLHDYQSWWKPAQYNPQLGVLPAQMHSQAQVQLQAQVQAQTLQQLYSSQLSAFSIPQYESVSQPTYMRQSPIGHMPERHMSPPNYSPYLNQPYPNIYEPYPHAYSSRDFLDEALYAPPTPSPPTPPEEDQVLDLTVNDQGPEALARDLERRRKHLRAQDRANEEARENPGPLDLTKRADPEGDGSTPAEDPGIYSLFSNSQSAWGQVAPSQQPPPAHGYSHWNPYGHASSAAQSEQMTMAHLESLALVYSSGQQPRAPIHRRPRPRPPHSSEYWKQKHEKKKGRHD